MTIKRKWNAARAAWLLACGLILSLGAASARAQQLALENIGFVSLPDTRFEIELGFNGSPPAPEVFLIENPARLTLDFSNVVSQLDARRYPLDFRHADSVVILEAQGRTRMVVNLHGPTAYATRVQGNSLIVTVGEAGQAANPAATAVAAAAAQPPVSTTFTAPAARASDISGIDFRRGAAGAGQVVIDLARTGLDADIRQNGTRLELEFRNANITPELQMRLDVTDFGTPVESVSMYGENGNVYVRTQVQGQFEYQAYQRNGQYLIDVTPVVAAQASSAAAPPSFSGERISMNFQDIDVRAALQILADFNDFSLVVGDNVSGNITLRLINVPWDQALDLVLRSRGLAQRTAGNVIYVAPAATIADAERQALENTQQVETLAPLVTEYFPVNYAVASDILTLLSGESGSVLTDRGRASVDGRTNTLIVQDVPAALDSVRSLLDRLDVPVRQVLIEARIVNASTNFSKALGVRWGGGQTFPSAGDQFVLSGSLAGVSEFGNNITDFNQAISQALLSGSTLQEALATNVLTGPSLDNGLVVDLGAPSATSSIALGFAGNNGLLQLELSALEASGNGEVIAQPKVTTQDQQTARIESGLQIPYQNQAGGTAGGTTTQFVTAALSLEVTPQITPDGRIIMLLDIHQDSVVPGQGSVPAIATNSVVTRVLVNDGETVVLGGVFREEVTTTVSKTPLLGDLPYLGNLFKRTENSESKTELLIFITPSIINDLL